MTLIGNSLPYERIRRRKFLRNVQDSQPVSFAQARYINLPSQPQFVQRDGLNVLVVGIVNVSLPVLLAYQQHKIEVHPNEKIHLLAIFTQSL